VPAQEKLYVFYPATVRPQIIQDKIQECFSGVTVSVFGRLTDFTAKIELDPPDAILTKTPLILQIGNYTIAVQGSNNGKIEESYVLLSTDSVQDLATIAGEKVIGVIDILGRAGMNTFAAQFFPKIPKLKRVTKVEDLLPLLSFNMVSSILINTSSVKFFRKTSNLTFNETPLPETNIGIVALGIRNGCNADKSIGALKKLDKETSAFFEVDQWK
jgi:hypothetical protein